MELEIWPSSLQVQVGATRATRLPSKYVGFSGCKCEPFLVHESGKRVGRARRYIPARVLSQDCGPTASALSVTRQAASCKLKLSFSTGYRQATEDWLRWSVTFGPNNILARWLCFKGLGGQLYFFTNELIKTEKYSETDIAGWPVNVEFEARREIGLQFGMTDTMLSKKRKVDSPQTPSRRPGRQPKTGQTTRTKACRHT